MIEEMLPLLFVFTYPWSSSERIDAGSLRKRGRGRTPAGGDSSRGSFTDSRNLPFASHLDPNVSRETVGNPHEAEAR